MMTAEEAIFKMLVQVLENQQVLLWHLDSKQPAQKWTKDHIDDTSSLLENVIEK